LPVPPASASRRVLLVPVLTEASVQVPVPGAPLSTISPLASIVRLCPAVITPVVGRIVPLKFRTVHVLSVLAIAEVSKMRKGELPNVAPPDTFKMPPDSESTPPVPALVAPVASKYLFVVRPDSPPVLEVPQLKVCEVLS